MILLDAHVHIYHRFDLKTFFDSTFENFHNEAKKNGSAKNFTAILILTDWSGQNWFKHLAGYCGDVEKNLIGSWRFFQTKESTALWVERRKGEGFFLIAGRKIITKENLEVLAIITGEHYKEGLTLQETVQQVKSKGGVPVVPWAVGKWLGYRGTVVKNLIFSGSEFLLCDNGNRPIFWPYPDLFKIAERQGIRVIAGSDPLHFSSEVNRAGCFGSSFQGEIDPEMPGKHLKEILMDQNIGSKPYGLLERPLRFLMNQITMQIFKKKNRSDL